MAAATTEALSDTIMNIGRHEGLKVTNIELEGMPAGHC